MEWPLLSALPDEQQPWHEHYFAMFSSFWGGIVTDPALMTVPVDDHLVHRGDGVFETCKCRLGRLYNLERHLDRLESSMQAINIAPPLIRAELREAIFATLRAGDQAECLVRILVSRGPGGFGVDPDEPPAPQCYIIAYHSPPPFMERHPEGAKVAVCQVPARDPFFASIKTCNYLSNALTKKAATDAGCHFAVGLDPDGHLTESATENLCVITPDRVLATMPFKHILPGTTMQRCLELAESLISDGTLSGIDTHAMEPEEIAHASEALIFGTTTNVTAVTEFEGRPVGDGRPGPVYAKLAELLRADIESPDSPLVSPVLA